MSPEKNTLRVNIFGTEYVLKGDSSLEHMQRVATLVDQKMREISQSGTIKSNTKLAILAALNIADEYFKTRDELIRQMDTAEQRLQSYIQLLDSVLQNPASPEPAIIEDPESGTISLFAEQE